MHFIVKLCLQVCLGWGRGMHRGLGACGGPKEDALGLELQAVVSLHESTAN